MIHLLENGKGHRASYTSTLISLALPKTKHVDEVKTALIIISLLAELDDAMIDIKST